MKTYTLPPDFDVSTALTPDECQNIRTAVKDVLIGLNSDGKISDCELESTLAELGLRSA